MLFDSLKELCKINGAPGRENAVSKWILESCKAFADEAYQDNLGSVIAFKKGKMQPKNKIMLDAHMDEVAFIITSVTDDGLFRFAPLGGINPKVVLGRRVTIGEKSIPGVIGNKAIHMVKEEEFKTAPTIDQLYIDIGAKNREEALSYAAPGESAYFVGEYQEFGDKMIVSKAIDDRIGCAVLLELIKEELAYDTWFSFSVQEEVGGRGAKTTAYTINPDIAIAVESTASGDVSGVTGEKRVCVIGDGAVVSYMDNGCIYDKELYELAFQKAREKGIPCQTKSMIAGGNNAGVIHTARGGIRTIAVSLPSRYIHSASNVACKKDAQAVYQLVKELACEVGKL